jgi:NAD(P)H-quinone oxidoreductase subunit N
MGLGPLVLSRQFVQTVEKSKAVAIYTPLEGGSEGRYQRRLRAAGYSTLHITARGLGDLSAYLLDIHGIRPPHLGKKTTGQEAAVGYRYFAPPMITQQLEQLPSHAKGLALWIIEGFVLSNQELEFLANLPKLDSRLRVVVEMGGDRTVSWKPLDTALAA